MAYAFDPADSSFNITNAIYLAHAADVAYLRSPSAVAWERLGLVVYPFRHRVTRTRGFLGVCDTHAVLAFRGSDPLTLPNWVTDSIVRLVERDEFDGRVHLGFSSALKKSWPKLESLLGHVGDRPLFLTGHSLGGALAVLTACRLAKQDRPVVATYTFGAPRVGDPTFCDGYNLPTYRVVNRLDLVPEIPLASLKKLLPKPSTKNEKLLAKLHRAADRVPCYDHVKTLVYIDLDGTITVDANIEPWTANAVARAITTRGKSFLDGVADHLIGNYIRGLQGQVRGKKSRPRRRDSSSGKSE